MKHVVSIALCGALMAAANTARADLMLMEAPRTDFAWYGVLMLGLSAASFAVASNGYAESAEALDKADKAYALYKAATTSADADQYHKRTERYRREAVAFESTANAAVFLGIVLGAAGIYSLFTEGESKPLLISHNRVGVRLRF